MQKMPKPVTARATISVVRSGANPQAIEPSENTAIAPRNVLRRPMKSEMMPPHSPPRVMARK